MPGNRLRLRTPPDSGGSFGVKQGVFPYIVLIAAAARVTGRPVKWIEDRLEHLRRLGFRHQPGHDACAAAVDADGRILALDWDQVEDCGAHLRAPEPATLYRMHGNLTGAYDIRHLSVRNSVVVTNKTPTGLNRGFGGPQVYFALERLMQRIAVELGLDPLDVIRRNLVPADGFPYRTASGGLARFRRLSGGDPARRRRRRLAELKRAARRGARRGPALRHRLCRRGRAQRLQHGLHHHRADAGRAPQGRPEERRPGDRDDRARSGRRVTVHVASVPQGQGHRTVLSQVVADVFGLAPAEIRVDTEIDTAKDAWSIASGNYSSRFAPAVAGTAHARRHAHRGAAGAHRRQPAERPTPTRSRSPAAASHRSGNPDNRVSVRPPGGAEPLGAGARCPTASATRSARPCSGARRN